jgi:putative membrane protein
MMGGYSGYGPGSMMWGGGSWLMMIIGGLFFLLLIAAGIGIVVWAASQGGKSSGGTRSAETHLDVLKRRYANGEIDKKQFEDIKKDLM